MTTVTHEATQEAPARKHFSDFLASQMWALAGDQRDLALGVVRGDLRTSSRDPECRRRLLERSDCSRRDPLRVPRDVGLGQACISARRGG